MLIHKNKFLGNIFYQQLIAFIFFANNFIQSDNFNAIVVVVLQ